MAVMFESSLTNDFFLQFLSKQVEAAKRQRFLPVLLPAGLAQGGSAATRAGPGCVLQLLWGQESSWQPWLSMQGALHRVWDCRPASLSCGAGKSQIQTGLGSHLRVTGCCLLPDVPQLSHSHQTELSDTQPCPKC